MVEHIQYHLWLNQPLSSNHHILYCNTFLDASEAPEWETSAGKNPESILNQTKD
jgi:hypothetical protein